jgi:hypothetical protein
MTLASALGLTTSLMALAFIQQSAEHLATGTGPRGLFVLRIVLCFALLAGLPNLWPLAGLALLSLWMLSHFHGPYNGGSDKMSVLVLWCLLAAHLVPLGFWQEVVMGYLAVQVLLSYFVSGKVKLRNPEWRSGQALADVFAFSAYPVSENLRRLSEHRGCMICGSWVVIGCELAFPLAFLHLNLLAAALVGMGCFHLANACLFGLNRFLWIWLASYPVLIWFQHRIMG